MQTVITKTILYLAALIGLASCTLVEPPPAAYPPVSTSRVPEVRPPQSQPLPGKPQSPAAIESRAAPVVVVPAEQAEQARNPYDEVPVSSSADARASTPDAVISTSAVKSLLNQAKLDIATGRNEAAISKLERALRIEPRNAVVWHQLAKANYKVGKDATAVSMAKKSNLYAAAGGPLERMNWQLIKDAAKRAGDVKTLKDVILYERSYPQ